MTKITVIGEAQKEEKKLKPIEFIGCIQITGKEICDPECANFNDGVAE